MISIRQGYATGALLSTVRARIPPNLACLPNASISSIKVSVTIIPGPTELMATRTFTFLGTGTSVGIPMVGCDCSVCTSADPRNQRYRCAVLIGLPQGNLLIDTPPELRLQLLRAKVKVVHAVLFTHFHADHVYGLDDLRPIPRHLGSAVPLYCTHEVERKIRQSFAYAFSPNADSVPAGYLPKLVFRNIDDSAVRGAGRARAADFAHSRPLQRVRLSHRRRRLLHRCQQDSQGKLAASGRPASAGAGRLAPSSRTRGISAWMRPWK